MHGAEERGDAVPDLPVHDDLEVVLRASEATAAAPSAAAAAPTLPQLRQPNAHGQHRFALQNSVANLGAAFEELRPRLAMTWPFELDDFQKEGVVLMECGENVFVAAHTSAGATKLQRLPLLVLLCVIGTSATRRLSVGSCQCLRSVLPAHLCSAACGVRLLGAPEPCNYADTV